MWIMTSAEQENLKRGGNYDLAMLARYHRFLGSLFGGAGFNVDEKDIPISYEEYLDVMKDCPGWSYGYITPRSPRWKQEFSKIPPRFNTIYEMMFKRKDYLWAKYPELAAQNF